MGKSRFEGERPPLPVAESQKYGPENTPEVQAV